MKLKFKKTPEQIALVKAMSSKDKLKCQEALALFANLMGPLLNQAYLQADTTAGIFNTMTFNEEDDLAFAIEPFSDTTNRQFGVWSSALPGGLPTNTIVRPVDIVRFQTRSIDSAASYLQRMLRTGRVDTLAFALQRMMQEIMVSELTDAWSVLLAALANATTNGNPHVHSVATAGHLGLTDFSKLLTLFKRINTSWVGGTPVGGISRPTDMFLSPEMMEQIRAFAFQPVNTTGANAAAAGAGDVIAMEDSARRQVWTSAGLPEFFGIQIHELLEFGINGTYTQLFDAFSSGNVPQLGSTTGGSAFAATGNDLIVVVDGTKDFAFKALVEGENGDVFTMQPDDQFPVRAGKVGFFGGIEAGYLVLETRGLAGLVV